mmetsp:Transcript_109061/g.307431  ORF Transcript_109061/g.307431 Transcript_109061/m.307431 type:complete len:252 (+) Transcript_109061:1016-1771(+)
MQCKPASLPSQNAPAVAASMSLSTRSVIRRSGGVRPSTVLLKSVQATSSRTLPTRGRPMPRNQPQISSTMASGSSILSTRRQKRSTSLTSVSAARVRWGWLLRTRKKSRICTRKQSSTSGASVQYTRSDNQSRLERASHAWSHLASHQERKPAALSRVRGAVGCVTGLSTTRGSLGDAPVAMCAQHAPSPPTPPTMDRRVHLRCGRAMADGPRWCSTSDCAASAVGAGAIAAHAPAPGLRGWPEAPQTKRN